MKAAIHVEQTKRGPVYVLFYGVKKRTFKKLQDAEACAAYILTNPDSILPVTWKGQVDA